MDVPFGAHRGYGKIVVSIDPCGNLMAAVKTQGGSFGASKWIRLTNKGTYRRKGAICDKIDNYDNVTDPLSSLGLFDSDCPPCPRSPKN